MEVLGRALAASSTCTEILILREGGHSVSREGSHKTAAGCLAQHVTLVPIVKEQLILPSSNISCDFSRVKIAIG